MLPAAKSLYFGGKKVALFEVEYLVALKEFSCKQHAANYFNWKVEQSGPDIKNLNQSHPDFRTRIVSK
jgi:hypothetical protein